MAKTLYEITTALTEFNPSTWEGENEEMLDRILDGLDHVPGRETIAPILFKILEENPECEFGAPGPIVHTLERIGGYETALRESLSRRPTRLTVWMVNRILNSNLTSHDRASWLRELQQAAIHEKAQAGARENAARFLDHQARTR